MNCFFARKDIPTNCSMLENVEAGISTTYNYYCDNYDDQKLFGKDIRTLEFQGGSDHFRC